MAPGGELVYTIQLFVVLLFLCFGIIANFYASTLLIGVLLISLSLILILCIFLTERRWALFDKSPKRIFDFISFNDLSIRYHNILVIIFDLLLLTLAWYLAYVVRFSIDIYDNELFSPNNGLVSIILIQSISLYF